MPMPPHTGRRLELTEAAVTVVAAGGLRALTHRAVDSEAGLPEGSCSSAFRTRIALLTALTEHVGHLFTVQVLDLADRVRGCEGWDVEQRLPFVIHEVVALFGRLLDQPQLVVVQAELSLEAQRQPALRAVLEPWHSGLIAIVEGIVHEAGEDVPAAANPAQWARTLVAAMQGVLLSGLQQARGERAAYLESSIGILLGRLP